MLVFVGEEVVHLVESLGVFDFELLEVVDELLPGLAHFLYLFVDEFPFFLEFFELGFEFDDFDFEDAILPLEFFLVPFLQLLRIIPGHLYYYLIYFSISYILITTSINQL